MNYKNYYESEQIHHIGQIHLPWRFNVGHNVGESEGKFTLKQEIPSNLEKIFIEWDESFFSDKMLINIMEDVFEEKE